MRQDPQAGWPPGLFSFRLRLKCYNPAPLLLALAAFREGDTIAILPGEDPAAASEHADIVICTGLGSYRNGIVGRSNAVVAVGGGAGTLQVGCVRL